MNSIVSVPWPVAVLVVGGVLLLGLGPRLGQRTAPGLLSLLVLLIAGACGGLVRETSSTTGDVVTQVALWGTLLAGTLFVLVSLQSPGDSACNARDHGLALVVLGGAIAAGSAESLPVIIVGLHLVALGVHAIAWRRRPARRPAVMSAWLFHSACLLLILLGLVTLFGLGGSLRFDEIAVAGFGRFADPESAPLPRSMATFAAVSLLAGLCGYAVVHAVHSGRSPLLDPNDTVAACLLLPLPAWTAMLVALRIVPSVLGVWTESAVTVTVLAAWLLVLTGGVLLPRQRRILPMLACGLMAHCGLWLVGVAVGAWEATSPGKGLWPTSGLPGGAAAALFSLCADGLALLALLAVLASLWRRGSAVEFVEDVSGLLKQRPAAGTAAAVCLASLCGVPPLPGFWGRWWLFTSAFSPQQPSSLTGLYEPHYGFLATCGVMIVGSMLIAAAYLRLFQQVVLEEPRGRLEATGLPVSRWGAGLLAISVLAVGLWPQPLLRLATRGFPPPTPSAVPVAPEQSPPERGSEPDGGPGPRQSVRARPDERHRLIDGHSAA